MSQHEVERVIGRAATDSVFREELIRNAREACSGYDLTEDELAALEALDVESLESFAGALDTWLAETGGLGA